MPHMMVKDFDGRGGGLALFWKREMGVKKMFFSKLSARY